MEFTGPFEWGVFTNDSPRDPQMNGYRYTHTGGRLYVITGLHHLALHPRLRCYSPSSWQYNCASNTCSAAAHGGQVACETELAVRAMYNLERAQAEPLSELAQLLHRRPKAPSPEAAMPDLPPVTEQQAGAGPTSNGSLVELALRFAGRKLPSFSPSGIGHSQSMQLPRLAQLPQSSPSPPGLDRQVSAASRPSRGASTVDVVLAEEEGDEEEGTAASANGGDGVVRSRGTPGTYSQKEGAAAAPVAGGVRDGPCMCIGRPCSGAQNSAPDVKVAVVETETLLAGRGGGGGCDFSLPLVAEAVEAHWIAPDSSLEAVALRMGDFR